MTTLAIHHHESKAIALPDPRCGDIHIRLAIESDVKFIDQLQKKNSRNLGFASLGQLHKNIADGHILIAEQHGQCVGYCISKDRYKDHEDVGIVYQLAVVEGSRRGLIGAGLIKAVFDRAAYGCKLFCCWCAQDLEANYFWESLGFVPLAFRTGSRSVRYQDGTRGPRIHIFWQRRIRENDTETPYWFPSETRGGAVKENRLVLPIPPGTSWQDAKPAILPGMEGVNVLPPGAQDKSARRPREKKVKAGGAPASKVSRGLWFAPPAPPPPTKEEIAAAKKAAKAKERAARPKFKNDPKYVAAARELRDRYLEQVNTDPERMLPPSASGKYDVSRQIEMTPTLKDAPAQLSPHMPPHMSPHLLNAA